MKASRSIQNYILVKIMFQERSWTEHLGKQYGRQKKAKLNFEEHVFHETSDQEQHETPSDYRSVNSGRCSALFIHLNVMLCLLQLLRRDMSLLSFHTPWAQCPSLVAMRSFYSFLSWTENRALRPDKKRGAPIPTKPLPTAS